MCRTYVSRLAAELVNYENGNQYTWMVEATRERECEWNYDKSRRQEVDFIKGMCGEHFLSSFQLQQILNSTSFFYHFRF